MLLRQDFGRAAVGGCYGVGQALVGLVVCKKTLLLYPARSETRPCALSCDLINAGHKAVAKDESPGYPLIISLRNRVLAIPDLIVNGALALRGRSNRICACCVVNSDFRLPRRLDNGCRVAVSSKGVVCRNAVRLWWWYLTPALCGR